MFLRFSKEAHARAAALPTAGKKTILAEALRIAWDRLGPESEYEKFGRVFRRGLIEVRDIEAAQHG